MTADDHPEYNPDDPTLAIRIWVGGVLRDKVVIDCRAPTAAARIDTAQARHERIAADADDAGQLWVVEVHDPAKPPGQDRLRFGTDQAAMHEPMPMEYALDEPHPFTDSRPLRDVFLPGDDPPP